MDIFFLSKDFLMNFSSGAKCQEFTENLAGIFVNSILEPKSFAISSDDASLRCGSRGQPVDNVNVVSYVVLLCSVVSYPIEWTLLVLRDPVQGYRSDIKADIRAICPSSRQQRGQRLWRGSQRHHACGRAAITCVCDCVPLFTRKSVSFVSCQKRAGRREIKGESQRQILLSEGENWFFLKLKWKWGRLICREVRALEVEEEAKYWSREEKVFGFPNKMVPRQRNESTHFISQLGLRRDTPGK